MQGAPSPPWTSNPPKREGKSPIPKTDYVLYLLGYGGIWIPNIHDLDVNESNYLALGLLVNSLERVITPRAEPPLGMVAVPELGQGGR
ncbi:hypothetical protein F2Q69_00019063 [Brassica cretica]|uniref:Uncharacterized protein n=1 Tax=Brassica cretica TaxID=69181 RepID=A0A8S9QGJ2_BRACR|nr:hypothetical protein F2Q69_00019063 [Brassica cretica]